MERKEGAEAVAAEAMPGVRRRIRKAKPAAPLRDPHEDVRAPSSSQSSCASQFLRPVIVLAVPCTT